MTTIGKYETLTDNSSGPSQLLDLSTHADLLQLLLQMGRPGNISAEVVVRSELLSRTLSRFAMTLAACGRIFCFVYLLRVSDLARPSGFLVCRRHVASSLLPSAA